MVRGQWSEVNGQMSMVRGQWADVNGQRSIGRGQKLEVRGLWTSEVLICFFFTLKVDDILSMNWLKR